MKPGSRFDKALVSVALCAAALGLPSCGPPDGAEVTPEVVAGCEEATDDLRKTNENMLPGRVCEGCHRAGGQAANSPFTVSGTVFAAQNSGCNAGGVKGRDLNLYVEVQDAMGATQPNGVIPVNNKGNFYSAFGYKPPMKIVMYQLDAMQQKKNVTEMSTLVGYAPDSMVQQPVGCATCHQLPGQKGAPGRVYFKAL